jgi:glycine cleavage system H protein
MRPRNLAEFLVPGSWTEDTIRLHGYVFSTQKWSARMKSIEELVFADHVRYAPEHEWACIEGGLVRVGISDYAQDRLGDITFAELPAVGDTLGKGDQFGTLESVKAVSELFLPMGGEVVEINTELGESPGRINEDPYGRGWIVVIRPSQVEQWNELMNADQYREFAGGL